MPTEIRISKHNALYQASIQLEELDYTKLYRAYSGIRKSQIEPRVLFKVLVCAYMKGVYSIGQLKHNQNFKRFLTGGKVKVLAELLFLGLSQNIAHLLAKCNSGLQNPHLIQPKAYLNF